MDECNLMNQNLPRNFFEGFLSLKSRLLSSVLTSLAKKKKFTVTNFIQTQINHGDFDVVPRIQSKC